MIDINDIDELVVVGPRDDLFLVRGSWKNGLEMTEDELNTIQDLYPDVVYEARSIICSY